MVFLNDNEDQENGEEHDSPSATPCPQDDDVTFVHVKVDIHEDRIAFWPETGEVLHSKQRSHGFERATATTTTKKRDSIVILTQRSGLPNRPVLSCAHAQCKVQVISRGSCYALV